MTPAQRSMAFLRSRGWQVEVVEHWVTLRDRLGNATNKGVRKDVFGFADILGTHKDYKGTTYFQVTTLGNTAAREKKIRGNVFAENLLRTGNRIVIHGWAEKKGLWGVMEIELKLL